MSHEILPCSGRKHFETDGVSSPEQSPLRRYNFDRAVLLTEGVIADIKSRTTLPEPITPTFEDGSLTKAWVWLEAGTTLAQVGLCTSLDDESDTRFHTRIGSSVGERDTEDPIVWAHEYLNRSWDIDHVREDLDTFKQTLRDNLHIALYDLEDAEDIIFLCRKNLAK